MTEVLLVGAGGYGALYVDELFADEKAGLCKIAGIVDPMIEMSSRYQKIVESGVPVFKTMQEFYQDHDANLACIAVPTQFHTPYSMLALQMGSHVLCEKPLSGNWPDAIALEAMSQKKHRFVMTGFQWSHDDAILALKRDITNGVYGAPEHLKTLVLWPRRRSYFRRGGIAWAGKRYAPDGTPILDSVASNAAAHYLHNMLFVLGIKQDEAMMPTSLDVELFRANPVETFDTAVIRANLPNGGDALFVASHATAQCKNPCFEYQFTGGTVSFDQDNGCEIVGHLRNGKEIHYGNPFADQAKKIRIALANVKAEPSKRFLPCTPKTAVPHTRCICAMENVKSVNFPGSMVELDQSVENDPQITIKGLYAAMEAAYNQDCLLSELRDVDAEVRSVAEFAQPIVGISLA